MVFSLFFFIFPAFLVSKPVAEKRKDNMVANLNIKLRHITAFWFKKNLMRLFILKSHNLKQGKKNSIELINTEVTNSNM